VLRSKLEWSVGLGCQTGHRSENAVNRNICWIQNLIILVKFICQYVTALCLHTVMLYRTMIIMFLWKGKVKCTLVQALRLCTGRTAHRGPTFSWPTALDGGWGFSVTPRPLFTPGKYSVPIVHEAEWAPGPVWTVAENLASTGIRSPDPPARSQSLYRLRYPAHHEGIWTSIIIFLGARSSTVGWGTALQVGRSRVRFSIMWLEFFIDIILPAALWSWGWLSL